ncbi:triose-phosphate transporter family-domain-containing protein [Scenedesmus sp. NREL 46B-D3]|nr:triose-phosphate transporter family-domain-containing protein [Scenedesmus sp. NREL 46B-D3]
MSVAGMGMAASGAFSYILCHVTKTVEAKAVISRSYWVRRIMPVGFFMAATLWAGNLVYLYLSVSFIQMLKAFTPVITMFALFLAKLEVPTGKVSFRLGIALGTALAAYGEVHNSFVGVAIMLFSEAAEAIRLVMTQLLLQGLRMGPFEGVMWMAPACWLWLMLGAAVMEWPRMLAQGHHLIPLQHPLLFLLAACLGFAVNVLAYATIKLASSLTLKVLGCVKNAVVILAAMLLFAEQVTPLQAVGYVVSTAAFGVYTHIKMTQIAGEAMQPEKPGKP